MRDSGSHVSINAVWPTQPAAMMAEPVAMLVVLLN